MVEWMGWVELRLEMRWMGRMGVGRVQELFV